MGRTAQADTATIECSISPRRRPVSVRTESTYMPARNALSLALRLLILAAVLGTGTAHADSYAEVNQLLRSGNTAQAIARAESYLAGNSRDPQMRFLKGVAQTDAGQTNDAIATFHQLVEEYPELAEPYNNLAVIYAGQGDLEKARAALEMAVRNNPNYAVAHENLGDIYVRLAYQSYTRSQELDPRAAAHIRPKLTQLRSLLQPATTPAAKK